MDRHFHNLALSQAREEMQNQNIEIAKLKLMIFCVVFFCFLLLKFIFTSYFHSLKHCCLFSVILIWLCIMLQHLLNISCFLLGLTSAVGLNCFQALCGWWIIQGTFYEATKGDEVWSWFFFSIFFIGNSISCHHQEQDHCKGDWQNCWGSYFRGAIFFMGGPRVCHSTSASFASCRMQNYWHQVHFAGNYSVLTIKWPLLGDWTYCNVRHFSHSQTEKCDLILEVFKMVANTTDQWRVLWEELELSLLLVKIPTQCIFFILHLWSWMLTLLGLHWTWKFL